MTEIVAVDIGGTHARFAVAEVERGRVVGPGEARTPETATYPGLRDAWRAFGAALGRPRAPLRFARARRGPWAGLRRREESLGGRAGDEDRIASAALDRFRLAFGAVAGDVALAQGADGAVIAGGVGQGLAPRLPGCGFRSRFVAKNPFERGMEEMPVKIVAHPQPGLFGAAAAFAAEHGE